MSHLWLQVVNDNYTGWGPGTCLSGGGGGPGEGGRGSGGEAPPPSSERTHSTRNRKLLGSELLSAWKCYLVCSNQGQYVNAVNAGFPHLPNTQQVQQSGTFTIFCHIIVICKVNQNPITCKRLTASHEIHAAGNVPHGRGCPFAVPQRQNCTVWLWAHSKKEWHMPFGRHCTPLVACGQ